MSARSFQRGFTLAELAVVAAIVVLLLGNIAYTLSSQTDLRNQEETKRRLEHARELLLGFAVVNGRLPCPARCANWPSCTTASSEVIDASGRCIQGVVNEDYYGGCLDAGSCSAAGYSMGGLLPAQTLGFQYTDPSGYAVDAWGNRIRYAVAKTVSSGTCTTSPGTNRVFTNAANLKTYGLGCQPGDLLICKSSTGATTSGCGGGTNQLMTANLVMAIVFSVGKNGATSNGSGADEAMNVKTSALSPKINPVFVWHTPTASDFANGEFDDQMVWLTVGEFYGKLVAAGVLP